MTKNLVIVESPSKSKTIEKYLGKDYKVVSSKGHIRDLATTGKYGLGVDVDNDFKPNYIPVAGKKKLISELKKLVKDSDEVILATDPDREGEAISWHLLDTLGIKDTNYERVLFHEITKDKVLEAIKNPTKIDYNLVRSQETRRILDRIIGFRLSKLMQSKTGGKSAGRVQSVALKLIVDREREISSFNSEEYWTITSKFDEIEADLFNYNHKDIEINTEEEADSILSKLSDKYKIESVERKKKSKETAYKQANDKANRQNPYKDQVRFNEQFTDEYGRDTANKYNTSSDTYSKVYRNQNGNDTANKYIAMVTETISACVIATNQTYVETLKKKNAFTAEAQKEAFQLTYNAVMAILTDEAKAYLAEIYGDVTAYITNKIEAEVNISKIVSAE